MENKDTEKKVHRVVVDRDACIGATTCVVIAPQTFELDEESIAVVKPDGEKVDDNTLLMAAQSCPTAAISLYDEDGNKIFPSTS